MLFHDASQAFSLILAGASLGYITLFSFVLSPVAFANMDAGRAERLVKHVIKSGHGLLALIALLSGVAALLSGAIGGASVAAIAAVFALMCQWALAPREDKPIGGHRVVKTARIVASGLTFALAPILIGAIVLTMMGI
ncbi:MAG TPA: hypothetical protein VG841_13875 [Caulobacterales bacterium]|nr:hypothetical protein [Caulobacterales bacterium]